MPILRWLHLTDLHFGDPHVKSLWSDNIEAAFVADLRQRAAELGGTLDLLLFTGDLVYSGSVEQFVAFETWLQRLYGHLDNLGMGKPLLLAVPGNHDLDRPEATAAQALIDGWHSGTLQPQAHPLLTSAFAAYQAWWVPRLQQLPKATLGLLSGDFAVTVEKGGYTLGIIGLNSAFLHLVGGNLQGQLALSEEQLSVLCGGAVNDWINRHHLTLLLTHHPPSWLRNSEMYATELAPAGRFAVHLCGHMHTAESRAESRGEGPLRRLWQGASLFGLEFVGGNLDRQHGYALGILSFDANKATLQQIPRRAHKQQGGHWSFAAESNYHLVGNSTPAATLPLAAPPPPDARLQQEAPGGPYNPESYVQRGKENEVLDFLRSGSPIVLVGPAHIGKSTFMAHIQDVLMQQEFWRRMRVYEVSGSKLAGQNIESVLENFAQELCRIDVRLDELWAEESKRPLTKQSQLDRLFARGITTGGLEPILLLLDNADFILTQSYAVDFVSLLRVWNERSKGKVRVVLTASTSRSYHSLERSDFADRFHTILLPDFDVSAIQTLASRYLPGFGDGEIAELHRKVGGHPYFVRFYLYHAARRSISLALALADRDLEQQLLTKIAAMLREIPAKVLDEIAVCYSAPHSTVSQEVRRWLRSAGLLSEDERGLRCQLYERFFRDRLGR